MTGDHVDPNRPGVRTPHPRTTRRRRATLLAIATVGVASACAAWRPLAPTDWEQATTHVDVFRTRLRVTRLDGRRLYLEQPQWSATTLRGVYPAGWPPVPPAESTIVIPRDSIARLDRLESDRSRTTLYLAGIGLAGAAVAATMR